jgi:hypothetical protein
MQMNRDGQLEGLAALGLLKVSALDHVREEESAWTALGDLRRGRPSKKREGAELFGFDDLDPLAGAVHLAWLVGRRDVLRDLEKTPRFTTRLAKPSAKLPRLVDPADATASLDARARSYLHANCAQCHVEAGGGNSAFDVHVNTARDKTKIFDVKPLHDPLGVADPRIIAPGDPARSLLFQRITRRGPGQMPPLATSLVDERSAELLRAWIQTVK